MIAFIDAHRDAYRVEPICRVLPIAPSTYFAHVTKRADPTKASARARRDGELCPEIRRVFDENFAVYGVRKVWRQLGRENVTVARCTVARLMRQMGLQGVVRGKAARTTISDRATPCPADRVNRQFQAPRPNALWLSDFTYVATWQGFVYVAFVIDAYARRIVGWRVSRTAHAGFVLDALEQALHDRRPVEGGGLIHHSDRGVQGGFKWSSQHPDGGGCDEHSKAAIGSVWPGAVAVTRSTAGGGTRGTEPVLGGDRCRVDERGGCSRGRRVATCGNQMVPKGRRHATSDVQILGEAALWALSLVCGAGGDCACSRAGPFHSGDRTPAQAIRFDHLP